jgi:hypothetical protein
MVNKYYNKEIKNNTSYLRRYVANLFLTSRDFIFGVIVEDNVSGISTVIFSPTILLKVD